MYSTNYACIKYLETLCLNPPCNDITDPAQVTLCRFLLSSCICIPILYKNRRQHKEVIIAGIELGFWMTINYVCQGLALELINASKCAFISSLSVAIVPIMMSIIERKRLPTLTLVAAFIALFGVSILEDLIEIPTTIIIGINGGTDNGIDETTADLTTAIDASSDGDFKLFGVLGKGDILALGIPFAFGYCVTRIEHYIDKFKHTSPNRVLILTASQCCTVCLASMIWLYYDRINSRNNDNDNRASSIQTIPIELYHYMFDDIHNTVALLWTGIITTIGAIVLQGIALQTASSTDASLIFSTEPIFGSIFAKWLLNETITTSTYIGGSFILVACILGSFQSTTVATVTTTSSEKIDRRLRHRRKYLKSKMSDISDGSGESLSLTTEDEDDSSGDSQNHQQVNVHDDDDDHV